jgi:hypothetical protein
MREVDADVNQLQCVSPGGRYATRGCAIFSRPEIAARTMPVDEDALNSLRIERSPIASGLREL